MFKPARSSFTASGRNRRGEVGGGGLEFGSSDVDVQAPPQDEGIVANDKPKHPNFVGQDAVDVGQRMCLEAAADENAGREAVEARLVAGELEKPPPKRMASAALPFS